MGIVPHGDQFFTALSSGSGVLSVAGNTRLQEHPMPIGMKNRNDGGQNSPLERSFVYIAENVESPAVSGWRLLTPWIVQSGVRCS